MPREFLWFMTMVLAPVTSVAAQGADSTSHRADSLRHRIEERFSSRAQRELGLTPDQTTKLRASTQQFSARRRELQDREQRLRQALAAQLRPGVAANQDSVAKLTDAMVDLKVTAAQASRDEMKELSKYLDPVQRARFFVMRERMRHRVKEWRAHRGEMGNDMRSRGHRWRNDTPGNRDRSRQESSGRI